MGSGGDTDGYDATLGFDKYVITGGPDDISLYDLSTSRTAATQTSYLNSQWHCNSSGGWVVIDLESDRFIVNIQAYRTEAATFPSRGTPLTFSLYSDWDNAIQVGSTTTVGSGSSGSSLVQWNNVYLSARFIKMQVSGEYGHIGKIFVNGY